MSNQHLILQKPSCPKCRSEGRFVKVVKANNTASVMYQCRNEYCRCNIGNKLYGMPFVSKALVPDIEMLDTYYDRSKQEQCSVKGCTNLGAENHHWAPKHIFGDECELWPQSSLCREHHDLWHRLTGTGSYKRR